MPGARAKRVRMPQTPTPEAPRTWSTSRNAWERSRQTRPAFGSSGPTAFSSSSESQLAWPATLATILLLALAPLLLVFLLLLFAEL